MSKPLYTVSVTVPAQPRAVYYAKCKGGRTPVEEVTHRVRRLAIVRTRNGRNSDDAHLLRRLDTKWNVIWETQHPSLQETFWHAEWEYSVQEADWEKMG